MTAHNNPAGIPTRAVVVAEIRHHHPTGTSIYQASRVFYPQHPSNAVEFDDAPTGEKTMLFGSVEVVHRTADTTGFPPWWAGKVYYAYWFAWLLTCLVGMGVLVYLWRH